MAFSPDGKRLASGSEDKTVRLWDPATGASIGTLLGHSDWVRIVEFSPDGKRLASGSNEETVRLWDPATGASVGTLQGHSHWVRAVAFSPDGKRLASGSNDKTVRLWDPASGVSIGTLLGHSDWVWVVAFSPDGKLLVSGSYDMTVRLWDSATGALIGNLCNSGWFGDMAFLPDGKRFASGSDDTNVRLWDINGTAIEAFAMEREIVRLSFPKGGRSLERGRGDMALCFVGDDGQHPACSSSLWVGHEGWIVYGTQRLLWLPVDFRPECADSSVDKIAIGIPSGRVIVVHFDPNALPAGKPPNCN